MCAALPARTRIVQSSANRWVKALRSAVAHPPSAAAIGDAVVALEGELLVLEAMRSGITPQALFFRAGEEQAVWERLSLRAALDALDATELLLLPTQLFHAAVGTETPQPVAALVPIPTHNLARALNLRAPLVLVLAALQDPGNVGTLLRSAEALGAAAAILLPGTATPWSGKALRASAGSALRLPWVAMRDAETAAALLRTHGIRSYAGVPLGGVSASVAPLHGAAALWIGNEGTGLSEAEMALCEERLTLATPGPVESLNAAVAGSLLLYESARQRAEASRQRAASHRA